MGVNVSVFIGDGIMLFCIIEKIFFFIFEVNLIMFLDRFKFFIYFREKRLNCYSMSFICNNGLFDWKELLFCSFEIEILL